MGGWRFALIAACAGIAFTALARAQTAADLSVGLAGPIAATVNSSFTYTITVTNNGPGTASGVTATNILAPGVNFVAAGSSPSCSDNGGTVTCLVGSLGSGANATVTVVAKATSVGTIQNVVGVIGNELDNNIANNSPPPWPTTITATGLTVGGISPSQGGTSGGTSVTIGGTGFVASASVSFGGNPAANVQVASATTITAKTPGHGSGPVNVVVTNPGPNNQSGTLPNGFNYVVDTTPPLAPASLVATATSTSQVSLTWTASTDNIGIDHYEVERKANIGAAFVLVGSPPGPTFSDSGLTANTTYLYRVVAVDTSLNRSAYSNVDLATTIIFTDDPITVGVTTVKAQHLIELRTAVNAVRTAASLAPTSWTPATVTSGLTIIQATDFQQLRLPLSDALFALGFPRPTFTNDPLVPGVLIKKVHVDEIRQKVK